MKAVFRHELSSYFTGMTGYVFGAFLLLFAGIYTMAVNLNAGLSNFEYVLSNLSFIFLIIVPILTMRVIAEERRQRTDQLLYSLPLSMTGVALGKYAALLVVFLVPTGIICLYPLVLSAFGSVYLPLAFGTAVGFFFLGAALLLVGILEGLLILGSVLGGEDFAGLFPSMVEGLSLFERFYQFVDGVFDLTSLVYFLTVIGVFLFLTVQSLEKRRWSE